MDGSDPKGHLRKIVRAWMDAGDKPNKNPPVFVTWKFLLDALRSEAVDKGSIADKIEVEIPKKLKGS